MNPSYFRIRRPQESAITALAAERKSARPELVETTFSKAIELAVTPAGSWRLPALFIYGRDSWTVFYDLAGSFSARPAESWLKFAGQDEFIFAGYNDAIGYGELIVIREGRIVREFLEDQSDPNHTRIDRGSWNISIESWGDVESFVDEDVFSFSENGLLWIG